MSDQDEQLGFLVERVAELEAAAQHWLKRFTRFTCRHGKRGTRYCCSSCFDAWGAGVALLDKWGTTDMGMWSPSDALAGREKEEQ